MPRRHRNLRFRLVIVTACTAMALTTVGAATAATHQAATHQAAAPRAQPGTATSLTSVGSDGKPGIAPSADSAVAENGRYVAFSSEGALKVSAAIPLTAPVTGRTGNWRIYVRDETGRKTTLLSDPELGVGTVPSISANGRLVSYDLNDGGANYVDVADRQATGKGAYDTPANLAVRQVTGTTKDLRYERIPDCPTGIGDGPTSPCGPRLSADGTTLVYPAQLSPESTALIPNTPSGPISSGGPSQGARYPGNVADFGFFPGESRDMEIDYTLQGDQPLTLGQPTATEPFSITQGDDSRFPECGGTTMNPGSTCAINVSFDASVPSVCPANLDQAQLETGQLVTNAADPAGQSEITLVAYCNSAPNQSSAPPGIRQLSPGRSQIRTSPSPEPGPVTRPQLARPAPRSRSVVAAPAAGCPAVPTGLRLVAAPAAQTDNSSDAVTDLGDAQIGRPYVAWTTVSPDIGGIENDILFQTSGCGIQLVNPADLKLSSPIPPGQPAPCAPNSAIGGSGDPDTCTAYLLVDPSAVGTDAAALSTSVRFFDGSQTNLFTYLTATGVSNVVVARRDASGSGRFAASPSTVVSVDGSGRRLPGASQASVSATGRYVAFTAPVPTGTLGQQVGGATEVWRHDSDAKGNRTYHPGRTTLVSCLPGRAASRPCARAQSADSPSISGVGSRVAFSAVARAGSVEQVYARDPAASAAVLVSLAATGGSGNGVSNAPAMSLDGSTVAYISQATNITKNVVPDGAANLYVRTLVSGPGGSTELASPTGASLPAGDDIALPAVDAHGQLVTFQTAVRLLPPAPSGIDSVYAFERFPRLTFAPGTLGFGRITAGTPPRTRTVTVTDTGPGPAPVTRTGATPPFNLILDSCLGTVLYAGTSCQLTILLNPQHAGHDKGTVTVATTDDDEPAASSIAPATATVIMPVAVRLAATPAVSSSGQVTQVTGTGFPAGERITLSWQPGLGTATVVAAKSGGLTAEMVIFPDDSTGPRTLLATAPGGQVLAKLAFLVEAPSVEPPFTAPPSLPATPATSPTATPVASPTATPATNPPATNPPAASSPVTSGAR